MTQPFVALGGQQALPEERDEHPGAEALAEVGGAIDEDLLDLRRAECHVGAERPEPDRHEVAVLVAPPPHRANRIGTVLGHRTRQQSTFRTLAGVPMLVVVPAVDLGRGVPLEWCGFDLADGCPRGHLNTLDRTGNGMELPVWSAFPPTRPDYPRSANLSSTRRARSVFQRLALPSP